MKYPNFSMSPIVIGFGENNLKKRIIAIMNFKKPTALTTALSAFMVIGVVSTGAFATAPKTEDPVTVSEPEPVVSTSEPIITASEPVFENRPADNLESSEPSASEDEPANENLIDNDKIWSEPDENGFSYNKSGDKIRLPVMDVTSRPKLEGNGFSFKKVLTEEGILCVLAVRFDNLPSGYHSCTYFGNNYAVFEKCDCNSSKPENYTHEEIFDDGIIRR